MTDYICNKDVFCSLGASFVHPKDADGALGANTMPLAAVFAMAGLTMGEEAPFVCFELPGGFPACSCPELPPGQGGERGRSCSEGPGAASQLLVPQFPCLRAGTVP